MDLGIVVGTTLTLRLLLKTARNKPHRIIAYIFAYPALATISFILPLENTSIPLSSAGIIWLLGLYSQWPELKDAYSKAKEDHELDKKTSYFDEVLQKFEDRFREDFIDFSSTVRENHIVPYSWNVFDNRIYRWIFLISLQQTDNYELEYEDFAELHQEIAQLKDQFNPHQPSERDLQVAWGVYRILCTEDTNIRVDGYTDQSFLENKCFQEKFVQEYISKDWMIAELKEGKEITEDYRETLAKLYEDGKLDKFGIREALGDLDEHIERVITEKSHYFILMNGFYDDEDLKSEIADTLRDQEFNIYTYYDEGDKDTSMTIAWSEGYGRFKGILAVSEEEYEPTEFYDKFVKDHLQNSDGEGYLSVHRADFKGDSVIEDTYRRREPNYGDQKSLRARQILTTGEERLKISLKDELIENYLSMDQLLSVLPLNLYLRDLNSDKKKILIENNEDIKNWAGIESLTDWANPPKTTKELAEYIQQNYFPEDSVKEWEQNIEKIQANAREVKSAIKGENKKK